MLRDLVSRTRQTVRLCSILTDDSNPHLASPIRVWHGFRLGLRRSERSDDRLGVGENRPRL